MVLASSQTKSRSASPGRTVGKRRHPAERSPAGLYLSGDHSKPPSQSPWPATWGDMIFGVLLVAALLVMFGLGLVILSEPPDHFPSHTLTLPDGK